MLSFYAADDYLAVSQDEARNLPSYMSADTFVGHRFKQILVDGVVVWRRDVGDELSPNRFTVDLTNRVHPGRSFDLALQAIDEVGSDEVRPGDYHVGYTWDPARVGQRVTENRDADTDERFLTNVWWGDLVISNGTGVAPPTWGNWKPTSPGLPNAVAGSCSSGRVEMTLSGASPTAGGLPVTTGVPFAPGDLRDERTAKLWSPDGRAIPLQTEVEGKWADGSLKWLLLDFVAKAPGTYALDCKGTAALTSTTGVSAHEDGAALELQGPLPLRIAPGVQVGPGMTLTADESGKKYRFESQTLTIERAGPLRTTVRADGSLLGEDGPLGRVELHIDSYAAVPYVRITVRAFNDTLRTLEIRDLALRIPGRNEDAYWLGLGRSTTVPSSLRALSWKQVTLESSGHEVPVDAGLGAVLIGLHSNRRFAAIRGFGELSPKSIEVQPHDLILHLVDGRRGDPYRPTSGEAMTYELLLGRDVALEAAVAASEALDHPPALFSPAYFVATGALGHASARDQTHFSAVSQVARALRTEIDDEHIAHGLRDFPDVHSTATIGPFIDSWVNYDQDTIRGMTLEYLMTGDRAMLDAAERAARNYADVDIIHFDPSHPSWVGLPHGPGPNHTSAIPFPFALHLNGLLDVAFLTGERDLYGAAVSMADAIIASGLGSVQDARNQGWPLQAVGRVYRETHDPKYLGYMHHLVEVAAHGVDPRRGAYAVQHGSANYLGTVPFMDASLATGLQYSIEDGHDELAARLLIGTALADAVEAQPSPGGVRYSPNPHVPGICYPYQFPVASMYLYAYELSGIQTLLQSAINTFQFGLSSEATSQSGIELRGWWATGDLLWRLSRDAPQVVGP
jgi:hypothetical protein